METEMMESSESIAADLDKVQFQEQENADSAHSTNNRYQSASNQHSSLSSGSSGYYSKQKSGGESSSHEAEKEKEESSTVDQNDEDLTKDSKQLKIEEWEKENQIVVDGTTVKHPDDEKQIKPLNDIHVELPENDNPNNVDDGEQYEEGQISRDDSPCIKDDQPEFNAAIDRSIAVIASVEENYGKIDYLDAELNLGDNDTPIVLEEIQGYSDVDRTNGAQPESFCCTVSVQDGTIVAVTQHLTDILGFPHDSWIGQPFVNFLHPKDRAPFASQMKVNSGDNYDLDANHVHRSSSEISAYALMRYYTLFESVTFGIPCKKVIYKPFKLILHEAPLMPGESMSIASDEDHSLLRFICAIEIKSIYKVPDEDMSRKNHKFSTRHTAAGLLAHIDGTAVAAIGYLPQEVIGKTVFDFYHLNDMSGLRKVYDMLMEQSSANMESITGQPYRFLIKNGCYITLETKWRRTFNPWTRELEFVIGVHSILKGPQHCNIFAKTGRYAITFCDEIKKNAERIQNEIKRLLAQPIPLPPINKKWILSKQCMELTKCMDKFRNEVKKKEAFRTLTENLPNMCASSPHHNSNYDDSENSSETPPTYQMLNYQENLNRYFNSNPVETMPCDFDLTEIFNEPVYKMSPKQDVVLEINTSNGGSGSGKLSFDGTHQMATITNNNPNDNDNDNSESKLIEEQNMILSTGLMSLHAKNMETMLIKSHKKRRIAKNEKETKIETNDGSLDVVARSPAIKRSLPTSCENDLSTNLKQHMTDHQYRLKMAEKGTTNTNPTAQIPISQIALLNNFNFVPVIHYVSAGAPLHFANNPDGHRLNANECNLQTLTNPNALSTLVSRSNAQNTHAIQYMNSLLNQSRPPSKGHLIYPYPPLMFKPSTLPTTDTKADLLPPPHTQERTLNLKQTSMPAKMVTKHSLARHASDKIPQKSADRPKEKYTTSDETECSSSTFYSSQLRTVDATPFESPVEICRQQEMMTWYEDKVRSQRLPWSEQAYEPNYGYKVQLQDPDHEIQSIVDAMKHMEQSNLVSDQLSCFLAGPGLNGQQPYVTVGDTPSYSGDGDDGDYDSPANMINIQCQSVEALLYEENASFP